LSKRVSETDQENDAYCITNNVRPLMSYGPKARKGGRRTYVYVEAIRKFADHLAFIDFSELQLKARSVYVGRMEHTFAVLKEIEDNEQVTGANRETVGNKRPLENDDYYGSKKYAF